MTASASGSPEWSRRDSSEAIACSSAVRASTPIIGSSIAVSRRRSRSLARRWCTDRHDSSTPRRAARSDSASRASLLNRTGPSLMRQMAPTTALPRLGIGTASLVSTRVPALASAPPRARRATSTKSGAPAWTACTQRFHTAGHCSGAIGSRAAPTQWRSGALASTAHPLSP